MRKIIEQKLKEIEEKEEVRILHCVESGSRAWGFASPDSDYDVRFIYVRKAEFYLKLEQTRDVIEWQLDDTLDINGWDIQKALRLLYKSNPTVFEWNNSPIVYKTTDEWANMNGLINSYFNTFSGINHYISMAKKNRRAYLQGEYVKLKKYFYVLRPLLAAKWIFDKGTPPPMPFLELVGEELDSDITPVVEELLKRKTITSEMGKEKRIEVLHKYIDLQLEELSERMGQIQNDKIADWDRLNDAFLRLLKM